MSGLALEKGACAELTARRQVANLPSICFGVTHMGVSRRFFDRQKVHHVGDPVCL